MTTPHWDTDYAAAGALKDLCWLGPDIAGRIQQGARDALTRVDGIVFDSLTPDVSDPKAMLVARIESCIKEAQIVLERPKQ